jgi:hypothetical protein
VSCKFLFAQHGTLTRQCRYLAELGEVVVGRVTEVRDRRWAVDIGAATRASLQLGAVALPGDVQRRRTADDELAMRDWYTEGDIIVAEVCLSFAGSTACTQPPFGDLPCVDVPRLSLCGLCGLSIERSGCRSSSCTRRISRSR